MLRLRTGFTVADAMTHKPIMISLNKTLRDAGKLMSKEHVGSLLVQEDGKIVGIITEQDMVRKGIVSLGNPAQKKIKEIMERNLVTTEPQEDIFEALRVMRDYNIRHLPVMHNNKCVGLVTMKDILKIEPDMYEILVEKIELREAQRKPIQNE